MRHALREGHSEGRVALSTVGGGGAIGVGALAGLAGEVTILEGQVLVATASEESECVITAAPADAEATLLVRADVPSWVAQPLSPCATYAALEDAVAARLAEAGLALDSPVPIRVRGRGDHVEYHVIAGSCPIAQPSGTPPWRYAGTIDSLELVGVFVRGAAGRLTHHDRSSHLHVVAEGHMGHLDEIQLSDAELLIPDRTASGPRPHPQ